MLTCQPRFSEASELCRFSVVESGPMMTDNCQLRPIRKYSKYRVGSKKTNLLSILACRSCNNVGSTLYSVSVSRSSHLIAYTHVVLTDFHPGLQKPLQKKVEKYGGQGKAQCETT